VPALLAVGLLLACGGGDDDDSDATAVSDEAARELSSTPRIIEGAGTSRVREREVEFNAPDGLKLKGSYYHQPEATALIVLLHANESDRTEWDDHVSAFSDQSWDVLALDIRGHGESNEYHIAGGHSFRANPLALRPDDAVTDLGVVLARLQDEYHAPVLPVAVVGAGVGANVAWLSTGVHEQVMTAVALSASDTRPDGPLSGEAFPDASPHDVLFVAGTDAFGEAEGLSQATEGGSTLQAADGTGAALLAQPDVLEAVLGWLKEHLPAAP
jgi:alpha-beta hydrolase superfamily lysophospholipase